MLASFAVTLIAWAQTPAAAPRDPNLPLREPGAGIVVVASRAWVFDAATARELCPVDGVRVRIVIEPLAAPDVDPLASLGSVTPTVSIDPNVTFAGDDREIAGRAAAARCIVLEGGTWMEWWGLLKPQRKLTRLGRAILEANRDGATVIGIGASGAYLCERSLLSREALQRPARDPHDETQDFVMAGLGLARGACFDFVTDGRTTPERMLIGLRSSDIDLGVWLAGPCAWIQQRDQARVVGTGSAFAFDLAGARRSRGELIGGRLVRLRPGDTFDVDRRTGTGGPDAAPAGRAPGLAAGTLDESLSGFPAVEPGSFGPEPAIELRGEQHVLRLVREPRRVPPREPGPVPEAAFDWIPLAAIEPAPRQKR